MRWSIGLTLVVGSCLAPVIAQTPAAQLALVTVTGAVQHPGSYPWTPELTVQQAVAMAGGVTDRASRDAHGVVKGPSVKWAENTGPVRTVHIGLRPNNVLKAGDEVNVPIRRFEAAGPRLTVEGAVANPGTYVLTRETDLIEAAIVAAGGLSSTAGDDVQIWFTHGVPGSIKHVTRTTIESHAAADFLIPADDATIVVTAVDRSPRTAGHVTVVGEVAEPGPRELGSAQMTVRGALKSAGGVAPKAGSLLLIRRGRPPSLGGVASEYEMVTLKDMTEGVFDLDLYDGDRIEVQRSIVSVTSTTIKRTR